MINLVVLTIHQDFVGRAVPDLSRESDEQDWMLMGKSVHDPGAMKGIPKIETPESASLPKRRYL